MSSAFPFTPIRAGRNEGTWNEGIVVVELNTKVSGSDALFLFQKLATNSLQIGGQHREDSSHGLSHHIPESKVREVHR